MPVSDDQVVRWLREDPDRPTRRRMFYTAAGSFGPPRNPLRSTVVDFDRELQQDRDLAIGRCEAAYINNGFYRGMVRKRWTRALGSEIRLRSAIKPGTIPGLDADAVRKINRRLTALYRTWCDSGEADAWGFRRPMGELQRTPAIDADVRGSCIVHLVMRPRNKTVPIGIELISGRRMRRPYGSCFGPSREPMRMPDYALVNDSGVQFADEEHSEVVGFWSQIRNGFTEQTATYQFLPADRARLLMAPQLVGVEATFPRDSAAIKMLANVSAYNEETILAARMQAKSPVSVTLRENVAPADIAASLATGTDEANNLEPSDSTGTRVAEQVQDFDGIYTQIWPQGVEKAERLGVTMPPAGFDQFQAVQLRGVAAAGDCPYSDVANVPDGSYSAGRQIEQTFGPQIKANRENFILPFGGLVWPAFVRAAWAWNLIDLPGFADHEDAYCAWTYTPPRAEALNPVDEITALRGRLETGAISEQEFAEIFDEIYEDLLYARAEAYLERRRVEKETGIPDLTLESRDLHGAPLTDPTPRAAGDGPPPSDADLKEAAEAAAAGKDITASGRSVRAIRRLNGAMH